MQAGVYTFCRPGHRSRTRITYQRVIVVNPVSDRPIAGRWWDPEQSARKAWAKKRRSNQLTASDQRVRAVLNPAEGADRHVEAGRTTGSAKFAKGSGYIFSFDHSKGL
jgi:hypothetical protein